MNHRKRHILPKKRTILFFSIPILIFIRIFGMTKTCFIYLFYYFILCKKPRLIFKPTEKNCELIKQLKTIHSPFCPFIFAWHGFVQTYVDRIRKIKNFKRESIKIECDDGGVFLVDIYDTNVKKSKIRFENDNIIVQNADVKDKAVSCDNSNYNESLYENITNESSCLSLENRSNCDINISTNEESNSLFEQNRNSIDDNENMNDRTNDKLEARDSEGMSSTNITDITNKETLDGKIESISNYNDSEVLIIAANTTDINSKEILDGKIQGILNTIESEEVISTMNVSNSLLPKENDHTNIKIEAKIDTIDVTVNKSIEAPGVKNISTKNNRENNYGEHRINDIYNVNHTADTIKDNIILVHGFNSSSDSNYIKALANHFVKENFRVFCFNSRGTKTPLLTPTFFHIGWTSDLKKCIEYILKNYQGYISIIGFSLGGNWTAKLFGEIDFPRLKCGMGISMPFDFDLLNNIMSKNYRKVFNRILANNLKKFIFKYKTIFSSIVDLNKLKKCRTVQEIDVCVTKKIFNIADLNSFYKTNSSGEYIPLIKKPFMIINASDDPVVPLETIPFKKIEENENVIMVLTKNGGHIGFMNYDIEKNYVEDIIIEYVIEQHRTK